MDVAPANPINFVISIFDGENRPIETSEEIEVFPKRLIFNS